MMQRPRLQLLLPGVALLAGAGCQVWTALGLAVRDDVARIIFYGDTTEVIVPDTVPRGVPFQVEFDSFGGGCVRRVARDDVSVTTSRVDISPYDRHTGGDVCTADLLFLKHTIQVRLNSAGTYAIRVIGHQTGTVNGTAVLSKAVVVR